MGKLKAFIIISGIIALAALVGLGFWIGPSLIGPWTEVIVANRAIVALVTISALAIVIALSNWKWWIKIIAYLLSLSLAASISGKMLAELVVDVWYIRIFTAFALTSFAIALFKAVRRKTINLRNLKNSIDFTRVIKIKCSAITLAESSLFFQFSNDKDIVLKKCGNEMQLCFSWSNDFNKSFYHAKQSVVKTSLGTIMIPDGAEIKMDRWSRPDKNETMLDVSITWEL